MDHETNQNNPELDAFLTDLHRLLDDMDEEELKKDRPEEPAADDEEAMDALLADSPVDDRDAINVDDLLARADASTEDAPEQAEEAPAEDAQADAPAANAAEPAAEEAPEAAQAEPEAEEPAEEAVPDQPAKAPSAFDELVSWTQKQRVPRHVAKLQKNQEQAYAEWLNQQAEPGSEELPPDAEELPDEVLLPPKKKHHIVRDLLLSLVALTLVVCLCVAFFMPSQPDKRQDLGERKDGVSTILLMGTDDSGLRTDAMVLLTVNAPEQKLSLVSIPKDTLVDGNLEIPKMTTVYGANGGGRDGLEMVSIRVSQTIGFMPDGYMLLELRDFAKFVDLMGGIRFDIPMDMVYSDPVQELSISMKKGYWTLDGQQATELMRFRSYEHGDLDRVQMQQAFLTALLQQAVRPGNVVKLPAFLNMLLSSTETNLNARNLLWLANAIFHADRTDIAVATLPGTAMEADGVSYYVLNPEQVAQTVNTYCNPYEQDVTAEQLEIRTN